MRKTRRPGIDGIGAAALLAGFSLALPGWAQESGGSPPPAGGDPWAGVEEMLVTGSSSEGLLADPTTSAITFDAADLTAIGAKDISDLARFTPNLEITTTSATTPTFFIRGVGLNDANSNAAGAIAIYVDDVPINAPAIQLSSLFDTADVEVLRGPQAYIDARNASGGMINTITKKPDGELTAFARSDFGNYGYYDIEGAIGFPILEDTLSGRIAFRTTHREDFIRNQCGNVQIVDTQPNDICDETPVLGGFVPQRLPSEVNDLDRHGLRAQFLFQPADAPAEMEWLLNVHMARVDQTSPLGQVLGTNLSGATNAVGYVDPAVDAIFQRKWAALRAEFPDIRPRDLVAPATRQTIKKVVRKISEAEPFDNAYDLIGGETLTQYGGFLRGTMQFGEVAFKSVTGFEYYDRERDGDFDFSPDPVVHILRTDDANQFSQNFGLETELDSVPVKLEAGSYLLIELLDTGANFLLQTNRSNSREIDQIYTQDIFSWGLFGSANWEITERLSFEAGARINWERKDFEIGVTRIDNDVRTPGTPAEVTRTWSAPTYGAQLTYDFTEDLNAYWKYTRGWKAGHINASVIELRGTGGGDLAVPTPTVAKPETIDAVEFGFNGGFLDGMVGLGANAFFYRYSEYQVFLIESQVGSPPQLQVLNANDARIYGLEMDFRLQPLANLDVPEEITGLSFNVNFAWLDSEFLDFTDTRTQTLPSGNPLEFNVGSRVVDFTGNNLPNTPEFTVSGSIEWRFDLGFGFVTPRYDFSWKDDVFFDPSQGVGPPDFYTGALLPEYSIGQRAYALHDFRLTYADPSEKIQFSGWVRNMTNVIYKRNVFDLSTAFQQFNSFVGDPRTYGASLTIKY